MFRKRRARLRHFVLPLAAVAILGFGYATFGKDAAVESADVAIAAGNGNIVIPAPNQIDTRSADAGNLKQAFDTKPATYDYAAAPAAGEPAVLSKIQTGINSLLDAGTELFVAEKKVAVGKGDTLMDLLVRNRVPRDQAYNAIQALSKVYDPRDLNPGHSITVFFHQDPSIADPSFSGLQIEKDTVNTVVVNRTDNGAYKVEEEEKEVHRTINGFRGAIDGSLYVSAKAQGVPDSVILDLIKMYSFNVDFQRDIQKGDKFEVMYEDFVTEDGAQAPGKGNIVYAKLTLSDKEMPLYRYTDRSGFADYYDATGHSGKKSLMKTPIDGARISSGFGMRKHPVLGYSKMHKGMDFAAPRGTPIYAAGDGKIVKIGPFSSYGKYIRIRHQNGIETAYAHMNGFKAGLSNGARVRQGQVIGYVGTTGRSTGPHLHYEVMIGGKQVNPNSIKLPTGTALAGKDLSGFKAQVGQINRQFDKLGSGTVVSDSGAVKTKTARKN